MSEPVRFGVIGTGNLAQNQHLPNLTRAAHARLQMVCDLREDVVRMVAAKYGVPQATTDYEQVLADPGIDAVVIATREDQHVPLATAALQAGKHVYVEKPVAETAEECGRLVEVQARSGKLLTVGFNRRMAPAYQLAKRIFAGHGGAKNLYYRVSDAYWMWGKNLPPRTRIHHEVCHLFDVLRYLTGSEVVSVYAVEARADDEIFTLKFASGATAAILSSGYVHWDMPKEHLEAIVELGAVTVEDFAELRTFSLPDYEPVYRFTGHMHPDRDQTHRYVMTRGGAETMRAVRRAGYETWVRLEELRRLGAETPERRDLEEFHATHVPLINYMVDKGWLAALDHLAQCIRDGRKCELAGPKDALAVARITEAAVKSRERGEVVKVISDL